MQFYGSNNNKSVSHFKKQNKNEMVEKSSINRNVLVKGEEKERTQTIKQTTTLA